MEDALKLVAAWSDDEGAADDTTTGSGQSTVHD